MQWINEGDANTRFFHSSASARRNTKAIWSLNDKDGRPISEDSALKFLGKQHFSDLFGDDKTSNIADQLKVIRLFPNMTIDEDIDCFLKPISIQEVEAVLKGFKKDKILGPDGWPIEFFLAFFDLIRDELVLAAEQARTHGKISGALSSTFLTLIPKCEKPSTFVDFYLISLCNLVYKVISKIVALRLKPLLNRFIYAQQFGFLKDRQIIDPVGITQELLHSIKTKNSSVLVLTQKSPT